MTILAELRAEVQTTWQRSPIQTVLWLDPQCEWERLLDQLAAELELVKYAGSQLELRVKLELEPTKQPRIVYVPLPRQALSVLKEYEFTLPVWDESLLHALRRWGVGIERDEEKSLLPLLPGLAARWSDRPQEDWRHLTASGVRARLFDDEQVRDFLADPADVAAELERDGALAVFSDFLEEAFDVVPASGLTPQDMARQLVQNLILTEATQYSSGGTFPYQGRLPSPGVRERCLRFLVRWLEARTQAQTAAQLLRAAEQDIPLGPCAAMLESIPDIQSSLQVERSLVQRVLTELHARSALDERAVLLHDLVPVFRRHAGHFWAIEGNVPEWQALSLAGSVVVSASAALVELPNLRSAAEIVQAYVDRWWRVDRAYQRYRAGFEEHGGLDDVADTVRKLHRCYLEETNKRFAEALAAEAGLEATGLPPQRSFWPASAGGSRAVLVLDAFRFDLARELEETLRGTGGQVTVELQALRAPLPSITPLGMASLLPLETLQVDVSDGTWAIRPGGADAPDLATKAGREQWLAMHLDGYKSIELGKLLDLPMRQVPRAPWLFVYSTTLDEAGHGGVISLTPRAAEEYVAQCARAIRKLASAGVEHIHVVTDHGFFLLDEVADRDLIPVAAQDVHYKSHRAIVGRDIASPGLLTFPLVGSDLTVRVPRATGIFIARGRYQFFHGGASLQEIVVPHLYATLPRRAVKFDVRLHAPSRITRCSSMLPWRLYRQVVSTLLADKSQRATLKYGRTWSMMARWRVRHWRPLPAPSTSFPKRRCNSECACGSVTLPASGMVRLSV
jgi:hypothetical protein